jgi:uncharacterized membrane protein
VAGIGFTLRRLIQEGGFAGPLRAFAYAAVISAGPWILSSIALAILAAVGPRMGGTDYPVFLALVSYSYAFSLLGVGAVNMVLARYLADRLFEGRAELFSSTFAASLAGLLGVQAVAAGLFMQVLPLAPEVELAAVLMHLAVNATWLSMIFLSAAKDFRTIVGAFVVGAAISVVGALLGAHWAGLAGQVAGYGAGFFFAFTLLVVRVKVEFGMPRRRPEGLLGAFKTFWPLFVTGFAYNLGIWIDKFLFWLHPATGETIVHGLNVAPVYDNATFLAYATIVPALAMFLLRVETDFYDTYRGYFAAIAAHARLDEIRRVRRQMADTLRRDLGMLIKVQAPLTAVAVFFAPEIFRALQLSWASIFVFRYAALGGVFHVLHLMVLILLLYLEQRKEAMALSLVFVISNAAFTWAVFPLGYAYYGMGYLLSCGLTLVVGVHLLVRTIDDLEYHVFMRLPAT